MEPIESSETSAYINTLTPGTYPKEKKLLTTNLHLMSLSSCELRTNCLTLLKGIIAVISVEEVTLFLPIRFLRHWTIENPKNTLWWHCWDRSAVRELLQCRRFCVMSNQRWNWFRTLQRKQYAAVRMKVKSSVRHSHFPLGESIRR